MHLLYMKEQRFSTGTWGGAVLSGFTAKCGDCEEVFVVKNSVLVRRLILTCPYCGKKDEVVLDNDGVILRDTSFRGE